MIQFSVKLLLIKTVDYLKIKADGYIFDYDNGDYKFYTFENADNELSKQVEVACIPRIHVLAIINENNLVTD